MQGESSRPGAPADGAERHGERESEKSSAGSTPKGETGAEAPGVDPVPSADPLADARAEAARMKDAWLRSAADFDNFRKRTRKEIDEARRMGREDLLRALLPVFDNLERAIQSAQRSSEVKAVSEGLEMVKRQFVEALAREGITRVPSAGHAFDPGVHEAIQQLETSDHAPGTVLAEVQPGYLQGDRLVRAALVVVAKAKSDDDGAPDAKDSVS
jgi:molecular chaperone GrpE